MSHNDTLATSQSAALGEKTEAVMPGSPSGDPEKRLAIPPSRSEGRDTTIPDTESQPFPSTAETEQGPENVTTGVQRWCRPRGNIGRLAFAFLSFFIAGMNDAAVGVRIQSKNVIILWSRELD